MNAFFRYRYKSSLFFSFLFSFCVLCVEMLVNFSMHVKKEIKFSKSPNTKTEERKREGQTTQTDKRVKNSFFINQILYSCCVLPIKNNTLQKMRTSSHHHDENNDNDDDDERIKLVVWDFDMTILRIHSFAKRISALDVPRRDYERDCADANFFRAFLREMKEKSIKVAIASFGKREVIETYLKCLVDGKKGDEDLAEYAFNEKKKSIVTPNDVGGTDGCSMKDKSRMLDALTKRYVLSMNEEDISSAQGEDPVESSSSASSLLGKARKQVVFFDDDEDNVNAAKKLGYAYAVHTPNAFERESWRELYWKIPKLRELFPEVDENLTHSKTRKVLQM